MGLMDRIRSDMVAAASGGVPTEDRIASVAHGSWNALKQAVVMLPEDEVGNMIQMLREHNAINTANAMAAAFRVTQHEIVTYDDGIATTDGTNDGPVAGERMA